MTLSGKCVEIVFANTGANYAKSLMQTLLLKQPVEDIRVAGTVDEYING